MNRLFRNLGILLVGACAAALASAQVSVPGVPLPQLPRLPVGTDPVTGTLRTAQSALTEVRKLRVRELLRTERETVETDPDGQPIVRRQVGALSPTPAALERARAAGFTVLRTETLEGLGLTLVVLQVPDGALDAPRPEEIARARSRRPVRLQPRLSRCRAPVGRVRDCRCRRPQPPKLAAPNGLRIGLIDSGVDAAHPVLAGANIVQARLRRQGISRAAWHGRRLAAGRAGRWIRERHPGRDPVRRRHLLRSRRRFDVAARGRARLDGARESGGREHQPGRGEEPPAERDSCAR